MPFSLIFTTSELKSVTDNQKKIYNKLVNSFIHAKYLNLKPDLEKYLVKPEFNVMHKTTDFNQSHFCRYILLLIICLFIIYFQIQI